MQHCALKIKGNALYNQALGTTNGEDVKLLVAQLRNSCLIDLL